jgi:uncharacterized membrane protein HdeD (DUF308 family)
MLVLSGILAMVAGGVAVLVPAVASVGTALFIGWVLLLASVAIGIDGFSAEGVGRKLVRILVAVITFAAGLYLLVSPLEGTFTLTVMLVIWFVGVGIARIATSISEIGTAGAGYTIAAGAASLLLGLLIARELPSAADWAIGLLVGIDFLVYGLVCLAQALAARRRSARCISCDALASEDWHLDTCMASRSRPRLVTCGAPAMAATIGEREMRLTSSLSAWVCRCASASITATSSWRLSEPEVEPVGLAAVDWIADHAAAPISAGRLLCCRLGAVGRAVIENQHLEIRVVGGQRRPPVTLIAMTFCSL